jgi:hypothetical protein
MKNRHLTGAKTSGNAATAAENPPELGATPSCGPADYEGGCVGCDLTLSTVTSTFQQ